MHAYLEDLAWACLVAGAVGCVLAVARPARGRSGQRTHRARPGRDDRRPDLRTGVTVMAIGASVLADLATDRRTALLASIPIFAVLGWNLVSWLVTRSRRRSAARRAPARPAAAGHRRQPGYGDGGEPPGYGREFR
jgi:hypothetical protein